MTNDVLLLDFPNAKGTGDKLLVLKEDVMQMDMVKVKINFIRNSSGKIIGFTADHNDITVWEKVE